MQEALDKFSLQRNQTVAEKQVTELKRQYEGIVGKLEVKIDKQRGKIQKLKLEAAKVPVNPDPVIIERPVRVETIVENTKYIPIVRNEKMSAYSRA